MSFYGFIVMRLCVVVWAIKFFSPFLFPLLNLLVFPFCSSSIMCFWFHNLSRFCGHWFLGWKIDKSSSPSISSHYESDRSSFICILSQFILNLLVFPFCSCPLLCVYGSILSGYINVLLILQVTTIIQKMEPFTRNDRKVKLLFFKGLNTTSQQRMAEEIYLYRSSLVMPLK